MSRVNIFLQKAGGHIAVVTALIVVTLLFSQMTRTAAVPSIVGDLSWLRSALLGLVGVGLIALAICFPIFFWLDLNTDDVKKNEKRVSRLILYSYSVAALSLAGSLLPFVFVPSSFPRLYKLM